MDNAQPVSKGTSFQMANALSDRNCTFLSVNVSVHQGSACSVLTDTMQISNNASQSLFCVKHSINLQENVTHALVGMFFKGKNVSTQPWDLIQPVRSITTHIARNARLDTFWTIIFVPKQIEIVFNSIIRRVFALNVSTLPSKGLIVYDLNKIRNKNMLFFFI